MNEKFNHDHNQVKPGPCPVDPVTGCPICPPPTCIDIIKVKKIFNECINTQVKEVPITGWTASNTQEAQEAKCNSVTVNNLNAVVLNGDLVRVTFDLEVCAKVPLDTGGYEKRCTTLTGITKTLKVDRAGEEGLQVQPHVFPSCLFCFISERNSSNGVTEVTCCIGLLILLKVEAEVQLLIPTYGYPPLPQECGEFIEQCPADFVPEWPPYPEQKFDNNNDNGCHGCKD